MKICLRRNINFYLRSHVRAIDDSTGEELDHVFYVDTDKGELGRFKTDENGDPIIVPLGNDVEDEIIKGTFRVVLDEEGKWLFSMYGGSA